MTDRPQFVANRDRTVASAINDYLTSLDDKLAEEPDLDIVTGYFNPRGYFSVKEGLENVDQMRLLIGAQPDLEGKERWRQPEEPRGEEYKRKQIDEALQTLDENLERDRNLLGFSREIDQNLQELVEFLRSDSVEVRRHEDEFVHGKGYMFSDSEGVIAGSSNFTGAGLNSNLELNIGAYDPHVTDQVQDWFEELWEESEEYDLAQLYEERFEHYSPYLIYLRVLYERYSDELEEEREEDGGINLVNFQEDGVRRAKRFLDKYNGAIVADEVGLGKTYIAGKILEEYVQENRQRALVVAPAYLRDGMWTQKTSEWGVQFEVVSYAELRQSRQLGGDNNVLDLDVDDYQLVVIDEAHAFRNPSTQQSHALRTLLRGDPPKDVVMLTATPVNNSLWDLYYLLNYFIKNDGEFANEGIISLRERFKQAQSENPSDLSPDMLFDVLDETTVRRTRRFIKNHYENAMMPDGDGGEVRISFPDSNPERVDYNFSETLGEDYFDSIGRGLAGGKWDDPELTLARYRPSFYLGEDEDGSELSLVGLLRTGLLKRFESSSHAFANTVDKMLSQNRAALSLMDEGYFPDPDAINEWVETDNDEGMEDVFADTEDGQIDLSTLSEGSVQQLRDDLQSDIEILESWHEGARKVQREDDEKLHALRDTLKQVASKAREDAEKSEITDEEVDREFRKNRKILLFSYYEDTVDWIHEYLKKVVSEDEELSCYEGRIAAVVGDDTKDGVSREDAVHGFAPNSGDAPPGAEDNFDILITTDVLGQGVNLQEARTVINYDLPWNPMRVVQRNGRIDRVNSPHSEIYPITFFPEERLDDFLELEHRVRQKLTQAARSIGVSKDVIPDMDTLNQNFAEKLRDVEAVHEGDSEFHEEGGRTAAAYSGEEYRQELRKGLQDREDQITSLPWAAGSGMMGGEDGYFFCARIGDEVFMRYLREDPDEEEDEIIDDTLKCLKRIECTEETDRVLPDSAREGVYDAWERAREDIYKQWDQRTDPREVQPDVRKLFREVGQHLSENPPEDVTQDELQKVIDSVEAPRGRRYERELRSIYEDEDLGPIEKSRALIEKVDELGLQPYEAPDPLPIIDEDEVKLICWMAITAEENEEDEGGDKLMSQVVFNS